MNAPPSNGDQGPSPVTIYAHMARLLDASITSEVDVWRTAKGGIPIQRYLVLVERFELRPGAVGSELSLRRRFRSIHSGHRSAESKDSARLTQDESERLIRLVRIISEATLLFGDETAATNWLNTRWDLFQDEDIDTPMRLAETDCGARFIETMIFRTAHGSF